MPGTLFDADKCFPDLTGQQSTEQKLIMIQDYLYLLLEHLRWTLRNLSPDNFNEAETLDWIGRNIKAETVISNTLITNELYADYGDIADLTVDALRTDYRKAARYLSGDASALDFLYIHDEVIDLRTATVRTSGGVPLTEQLHRGSRYFWWTDSSMTQMTGLEDTGYPVTVYQYDELLKASLRFDSVNGVKIPTLILGAGTGDPNDPDLGKGFLRKDTDSLDLWLHGTADRGLFIGDYTDLVGARKTTQIDFSDWDNGAFTETVDGNLTGTYAVTFDANGYPTKITDGDGHETEVLW